MTERQIQPDEIVCIGSCSRERRCRGCALSDEALGELRSAVEARTGREMTPESVDALFSEAARVRCGTRQARVQLELQRLFKGTLPGMKADKAVLDRAKQILQGHGRGFPFPPFDQEDRVGSDDKLSAMREIDRHLLRLTNGIRVAEGRDASEMISMLYGWVDTHKLNPRSKHPLNILVLCGINYWCWITGDELESLSIGHPDHPGPFLQFLGALAEGMRGGITMHSLHDKARQIAGRRG